LLEEIKNSRAVTQRRLIELESQMRRLESQFARTVQKPDA